MLSEKLEYSYASEKSESEKSSIRSDLRNDGSELRRSSRFRKNVKFYGNVVSHSSRSK